MRPQRLKRGQKTPKCPEMAKNGTFFPITFYPSYRFLKIIYVNIKKVIFDPEKTPVRVPWGLLGLKNTPFGGLFLMFVENAVLYVVIGVLYVAEFKFTGPNT